MKIVLFPLKFAASDPSVFKFQCRVVTKYQVREIQPGASLGYKVVHETDTMDNAFAFVRQAYWDYTDFGRDELHVIQSEINILTGEITLLLDKQDVIRMENGDIRLGHRSECEPKVDLTRLFGRDQP